MMTSNLLSRLLPTNPTGRSIYDDLRAHDEGTESDLEERAGLALDEENLQFRDDELGNVDFNGEDSRITSESTAFLLAQRDGPHGRGAERRGKTQGDRSKWLPQSPRLLEEDGDDEVPHSLLIEGSEMPGPSSPSQPRVRQTPQPKRQPPIPGPPNRENRAHWEAAQAQQRLHQEPTPERPQATPQRAGMLTGSARDKAMWRWINVTNLDNFMAEVYDYYLGAGIWCILLERTVDLATSIFVAVFTTFLTQCVEYDRIPNSRKLSEVIVPKCTSKISGMPNVAIWLFTLYSLFKVYQLVVDVPRLMRLRDFYEQLLVISDSDMQTVLWQDVVARIMALRDANPITVEKISPSNRKYLGSNSKERLDAHDIANRLMRKENYLIALFNKDILDLTLQFPFLGARQLFSRTLLWNLDWCIMGLIFNEYGQVRQLVLKDSHRKQLSDGLKARFVFAGYMNVILAPVIILYLMVLYFFRYFNEYKKDPAAIGSRRYTPLAEWKFREFNELHHLFHQRLNMSYPFASRYLDQFPKVKTAHFARFVAFVAGAIVSVLVVTTLLDPELFLTFQITPDRTVAFYVTLLGAVWAAMNGSIPEENLVFDPEYALRNVIDYTHYKPPHWENRLHSDEVKREFATLYQMKIMIFLEEILNIIITPFLLWFSLSRCSDQIIDFFREFTVHVDGVGYVCSFAVFDFKRGDGRGAPQGKDRADLRDDYYSTKHGKMTASYYGFIDNYLLNPKTGVQGHVPPGMRQQQFHPPPAFPGLMSPTLGGDMQTSRMGRSERRPGSRAPGAGGPQSSRTPRFAPAGAQGSPMTSILLDPHHQPSTSGFGGRSVRRTGTSRSRYQARNNIIEEPTEDEDESTSGRNRKQGRGPSQPYESVVGLEESRWETSPTRGTSKDAEDEGDGEAAEGGVLGLFYQFHKAQTDGRTGVNI
ncbi:Autophagy-related protein 9 [Lachnellula arida]|uniref:Autophagy-related protein 9 n=1 Tax=Lachnellula arida TaxID=1316785 RepID=A0A8T9B1R7_9HELO|nr:Autophagy-related protein 9 [Lachnellula arida]